jgi:ferredoxin-NADP reductase
VASAPDASGEIELTVERLADGEVSTFLHEVVEVGDELEVRGPIGGWFVWEGTAPALLVGGGSGVVPLMSMLRLARGIGRPDLVRLVVSVRAPEDLYYPDELSGPETTIVHTRRTAPGGGRAPGRLVAGDLPGPGTLADAGAGATAFVCGSSGFADHVTGLLVEAGWPVGAIRVERFGPSAASS